MPVRYDIAAQVPQVASGGMDPMNAFATMQAMSYRQQQNALAQLQAQKLQRELQIQNVLSGLDVSSPSAINVLSRAGYLPEALSVMGSQRAAARERAYEAAQLASAEYQRGQLGLGQREFEEIKKPRAAREMERLDLEKNELREKIKKESRIAGEAELSMVSKRVAMAQDILSRMVGDPDNYQANLDELYKFDPKLATHLPQDKYDEGAIKRNLNTAEYVRKTIETAAARQAEQQKVSTATPAWAPGLVLQTTEAGGARLVAPSQPNAMIGVGPSVNAMAPASPIQNSFANAPAPEELIGTPAAARRDAARSILSVANYDPEKGGAYVADLIRSTPTSAWRESIARAEGKISGEASKEVQNVGRLRTILDNMVLAATNFKLGGQISDADVRMLKEAQSDMGNPNLQPEERLARWDEVMRIQAKMAGYKYVPVSTSKADKAAVDEDAVLRDVFGAKK